MARRIGAGVLLVLASVGLLTCLAVSIAVWAVRTPVNDAVDAGIDTATGYLDLASGQIQQVDASLTELQSTVDAVTLRAQQGAVAPEIATDLAARVQQLGDLAGTVQNGLTTLGKGVDAAGRLPGVDPARLESRIQTANDRLTQVQNRLNAVQASLAQRDNARIAAAATTASGAIADARSSLSDAQANIAATHASLSRAQERFPRWTALSALALTLLFVLLGAGQVSLIARAWTWMRNPGKRTTGSVSLATVKAPEQPATQPAPDGSAAAGS